MDEKTIAKGQRYLTVVADLDRPRVLYLTGGGRMQESLNGGVLVDADTRAAGRRDGHRNGHVGALRPVHTRASRGRRSEVVFDKFHVMQHLHEVVDWVRRTEHRALKQVDDDRLTGTKYLWLLRPMDMTPTQRVTFRALQGTDLKVARALALKKRFRQFWDYTYAWGRADVLCALVLARDPQSAGADGEGGQAWFSGICTMFSRTCSTASPMPAWKWSTPRSSGSRRPRVASGASSTSRPPFISIAKARTSTHTKACRAFFLKDYGES